MSFAVAEGGIGGTCEFDNFKFQEWKKVHGDINTASHDHEGAPTS